MLCRNEYPILEFDDNPVAKLNPTNFAGSKLDTDKLVISFFPEVIRKLLDQEAIFEDLVIPGENPVPIYRFTDDPEVLLTLGQGTAVFRNEGVVAFRQPADKAVGMGRFGLSRLRRQPGSVQCHGDYQGHVLRGRRCARQEYSRRPDSGR